MPNIVVGQVFDVVTCQFCENDLAFQKAGFPPPAADDGQAVALTCRVCGGLGLYHAANIRQSQAQYPL